MRVTITVGRGILIRDIFHGKRRETNAKEEIKREQIALVSSPRVKLESFVRIRYDRRACKIEKEKVRKSTKWKRTFVNCRAKRRLRH